MLRPTCPDEWSVYTVVPTVRTRFQRHRFVPSSTIRSLYTFGKLLPATAETHPSGYALSTGASGFTQEQVSLSLSGSLLGTIAGSLCHKLLAPLGLGRMFDL